MSCKECQNESSDDTCFLPLWMGTYSKWDIFKSFKNAGFNTFSKMYNSHVITIMDYSSGIWGYTKSEEHDNILNRGTRYYLGVHQKALIFAIQGDRH